MKDKMTNFDEEYLWDQTGEADPEIQELERVMSSLRYQPRPLVIPAGLQIERRITNVRSFGPRLAIAATILLAVGAGALWLILGRPDASETNRADQKRDASVGSQQAAATVPADVLKEIPEGALANPPTTSNQPGAGSARVNRPNSLRRNLANRTSIATNRKTRIEPKNPVLAADELREAEAGKAKLMLALRVASTKLNFALRKAQGTGSGNQTHNQHRIG